MTNATIRARPSFSTGAVSSASLLVFAGALRDVIATVSEFLARLGRDGCRRGRHPDHRQHHVRRRRHGRRR